MLFLKHTNPNYLLKLFKSIEDIIPESNLIIDNNGLNIKCMDDSHTCLLNIFIDCEDCPTIQTLPNDNLYCVIGGVINIYGGTI